MERAIIFWVGNLVGVYWVVFRDVFSGSILINHPGRRTVFT